MDGNTVVFSCYDSLRAVAITPGQSGAAAKLSVRWSVTGLSPGPPVIAGGTVWDAGRKGTLAGYRLSDGHQVFSAPIAPVDTDFPSLSASGSRLFVPEGNKVVCYLGI